MKPRRRGRLIYNPSAGRFPAGPFLGRASKVLRRAGWQIEILEAYDEAQLNQLTLNAVADQCHAVFIAGGDGSVGQVAVTLAGSATALGVLPTGTANVWAQEIGLPRLDWIHWFALEQAAERLAYGETRLVDIGECNDHSFLLWAGVGLDAELVNSIEPRERWEKSFATVHYATQALWSSIGWQGMDLRATAGDQVWEGRYLVAVACNIPAYAGGLMNLAPGAKVDDGLLDFWLIGGESLKDVLFRVAQIFMGRHVSAEGVVHFSASEATFEADGDLPLQCDGEPWNIRSPISFRVRKQALRVLIPSDAGPHLFSPDTGPLEEPW
ncbi:MAG: diacylglycerol kinase family lipid kinase [Anaerolineales bacterium]|nr:MAG: diacylglycerol kinase family lipid kinase [Anaerolineales bacterium]